MYKISTALFTRGNLTIPDELVIRANKAYKELLEVQKILDAIAPMEKETLIEFVYRTQYEAINKAMTKGITK
jgi:hypothetical protein